MKILANIFISLIVVAYSTVVLADLTFSAPPRETPTKGTQMYGPIATHLSELLGQLIKKPVI